jgi:hypothetical protein
MATRRYSVELAKIDKITIAVQPHDRRSRRIGLPARPQDLGCGFPRFFDPPIHRALTRFGKPTHRTDGARSGIWAESSASGNMDHVIEVNPIDWTTGER